MSVVIDLDSRRLVEEPRALYPPTNVTVTDLCRRERVNDVIERHLPHVMGERTIDIGECDKIFASKWLSEDLVVIGTKCNKLIVIDICSNNLFSIPLLSNASSPNCIDVAGIHCIAIADDDSYLCTGAKNPNELAVYKLPEMIPHSIGQGHSDWIFDTVWLTKDIILTGSRDATMGIWKVKDIGGPFNVGDMTFDYPMAESTPQLESLGMFTNSNRRNAHSNKIRSLAINKDVGVLASLQSSVCEASLHFWDCCTFQELCSVQMPYTAENVCLGVQPSYNLYAVGSRSHISFIDGRLNTHSNSVGSIRSRDGECGIRSLKFTDHLISVGSGGGNLFFYDLRVAKYVSIVDTTIPQPELYSLNTTNGWVRRDGTYRDFFSNLPEPPNAIYSHEYSPSKSKILMAGGPLPLGLYGNYCSIWS